MSKSFWNRMESIPVRNLSEEDRNQAIKEWAEGNRHLEHFLRLCYENEVETSGCHSGHNRTIPYIDFRVDSSSRENLEKIIATTFSLKDAHMLLMFNGNPRSGPDWHRPLISVSTTKHWKATKLFKMLSSSLKENEEIHVDEFIKRFMDIYEFLKAKETPLLFRIVGKKSTYTISIECYMNKKHWDYYSNLFVAANFTKHINPESRGNAINWKYVANGKDELNSVMQNLYQVMVSKWNLELPSEIYSGMTEKSKALVMRRKFGVDRNGVELLNKWLNENKEPGMRDVNYEY